MTVPTTIDASTWLGKYFDGADADTDLVLWDTFDEHVGDTDGGHGERPTTERPKPSSRWLLRA